MPTRDRSISCDSTESDAHNSDSSRDIGMTLSNSPRCDRGASQDDIETSSNSPDSDRETSQSDGNTLSKSSNSEVDADSIAECDDFDKLFSPPSSLTSASSRSRSGGNSSAEETASSDVKSTDVDVDPRHRKLEPIVCETRSEHMAKHASVVKGCLRCKFYKMEIKWSKHAMWQDPIANTAFSWLIETPEVSGNTWGLGCSLCRWAKKSNSFARCDVHTSNMLNKAKLVRHAKCADHCAALEEWIHKHRPAPADTDADVADNGETLSKQIYSGADNNVGYWHLLCMLTGCHTKSSISTWTEWMNTMSFFGGISTGNTSRRVCAQMLAVCAGWERFVTRQMSANSSVIS
jgi:hypothetical protein